MTSWTAGIKPASRIAAQSVVLTTLSLLLSLCHSLGLQSHTHSLSKHTPFHSPSCLHSSTLAAADMAEAFVGKWNLLTSENFEDYMKELGKCAFSVLSLVCACWCCAYKAHVKMAEGEPQGGFHLFGIECKRNGRLWKIEEAEEHVAGDLIRSHRGRKK